MLQPHRLRAYYQQAGSTLNPLVFALALLCWPVGVVSNTTQGAPSVNSNASEVATITYLRPDITSVFPVIESRQFDKTLDVRQQDDCLHQTLANAICLPVESLLTDRARLANFSGLLWKLGTAGLTGSEHMLIMGDKLVRMEFVAGLLHLAGQRQITLLYRPLTDIIEQHDKQHDQQFAPGSPTPPTRTSVWQSLMRSENIVLHNEMQQQAQAGATVILDGRTDAEYWGQVIRSARGGHIPGADSSPYGLWQPMSDTKPTAVKDTVIAYAADAYSGLAFYSRLISGGQHTRIYLDGWKRWATDSNLPVDAASYPGAAPQAAGNTSPDSQPVPPVPAKTRGFRATDWLFWGISVALAFGCGYIVSRVLQKSGSE